MFLPRADGDAGGEEGPGISAISHLWPRVLGTSLGQGLDAPGCRCWKGRMGLGGDDSESLKFKVPTQTRLILWLLLNSAGV